MMVLVRLRRPLYAVQGRVAFDTQCQYPPSNNNIRNSADIIKGHKVGTKSVITRVISLFGY
jgi:hypothetical protein